MAFCSKVNDDIRVLLFEKLIYAFPVADIELYESEIRVVHYALKCGQIACICQFIKTDDPVIGICLEHMENKIRAYKTCSACYDDYHKFSPKNYMFCPFEAILYFGYFFARLRMISQILSTSSSARSA